MFGTPYALDVTGTEFELSSNSRVFDVEVYKPGALYSELKFTVTANSFSQAEAAAIEQANKMRELYLAQNPSALIDARQYAPADVRKMEVVRTHVYHFRHERVAK